MVIKAQTPAGFAEEYIIESIWNNRFPPGSFLPAERELSDLIGVTRTTLREVLQRLSRDGWLTIQHGKPTQVNNFWETSGLNILETLADLDQGNVRQMADNLWSVRTSLATLFVSRALRHDPHQSQQVLAEAFNAVRQGGEFTDIDYKVFRGLAFASGNPIYGLIINGLKGLYTRVGKHYFSVPEARQLAGDFYQRLYELCNTETSTSLVVDTVKDYGRSCGALWRAMQKTFSAETPSAE